MDIEQLIDVESISLTSVFKKKTELGQAPAAVAVVTQDDVRRLGITTIPEALRLFPGMDVARISSHEWAISARGFNAQFANKLLILVDGRTIYGPAYGGVFWGMQDMVMEDLDRIEVIRGPGAALWGANAVNGVVNVLSKNARDTQGWLFSAGAGTEDQPNLAARYGGKFSDNAHFRIYGKFFDRDGLVTSTGQDARDEWESALGGVRIDLDATDSDTFTFMANGYNAFVHDNENVVDVVNPPFVTSTNVQNQNYGVNVLGRWTHTYSEFSSLTLQAYYDHFVQEQVGTLEDRHSADFDMQHRFPIGSRHDVIWGLGYRYTTDSFPPNFFLTWTPIERQDHLYSAFVQDEITIVPSHFTVTLGSKFEHNDYTGFEFQPSLRLLWTPTRKQTVWGAISRAVRTPSRYEDGARVNYSVSATSDPDVRALTALFGNRSADAEELIAYELGYRAEVNKQFSFDVAGFYNQYDKLLRFVPGPSFMQGPAIEVFPQTVQNSGSAETFGTEISAEWKPMEHWRLVASYSYLHVDLNPNDRAFQGNPQQQAQLRSYLDLPRNVELNTAVFYVDQQVAASGLSTATIPSYVRLDVGLVWRPNKNFEIGLWGQNLIDKRHAEFPSLKSSIQTEIPRSVMGKVTIRF